MKLTYTLFVGDAEEVLHGLDDDSVDMVVTSPPYFDMRGDIEWPSYNAYLSKMDNILREIHRVLKRGRVLALNVPESYKSGETNYDIGLDLYYIATVINNFITQEKIIWRKPDGMVGTASSKRFGNFLKYSYPFYYKPNRVYEFIFILSKGKIKPPGRANIALQSEIIRDRRKYSTNVWDIGTSSMEHPGDKLKHSSMYPLEVAKLPIQYWSFVGDVVLDPFLGSGTTMQACKELRRSCVGIEINEAYLPLIKKKTEWTQQDLNKDIEYIGP